MKNKTREIIRLMLALFFYLSGIAFVRAHLRRHKEPLVRILVIHHIKNPANFERMVRFLAAHHHMISFDDFVQKRFSDEKINILLTLDDGYASWFLSGLPILEKYNVPVLLFVSSGFVDASDSSTQEKFIRENLRLLWNDEPLNWQMIQKLAEHPLVEIGGHTRTHPFLTTLPPNQVKQEIAVDKEALTLKTGRMPRVFAYPFGAYNDMVQTVASTEYVYAMTTDSNFYSTDNASLAIPRSNHGTVSNVVLGMWVLGAFDLAEMTIASIKNMIGD